MKKIIFYLICAILFLLPTYLVKFSIFNIPVTLLEILIYIAAILTLISNLKFKNPKPYSKINNLIIPVLLFIIAGIIGVIVSPDKTISLGQFKAFVFDPILFFWILWINITDQKQIKPLLYSLILSGIYVAGYSLWQYSVGQITEDGRVVGIFGYSPNYLTFYMVPVMILAILVFYFNKTKNLWLNFLKFLLVILFFTSIYLAGSRAAMGALVISAGAFFIFKYWGWIKARKITVVFLSCYLVILLLAGYQFIKPNFTSSNPGARITNSNNIRWEIYKVTITEIIPSSWLWGVGLGNFQDYFSQLTEHRVNFPEWISPKALTAHNIFLQTWMNGGLIGLVSFVWILVIAFSNINLSNKYSFSLLIILIAILIQGLVDTPYWKNDLAIMFWFFIFLILMLKNYGQTQKNI